VRAIDDEVRADVRAALDLAASVVIDRGVLDGVTWSRDDERAVDLHPAWRGEELLPGHVRDTLRIGRADLRDLAGECRETGRWSSLVAAANAWGYGRSGYGAWRTRRILALPEAEARLAAAVATLDVEGPVEAYYRLNNEGHLHGWAPALFTRFLDAADLRSAGRALGLDPALADAVNTLVAGSDLAPADWGTAEYAFYLGLMHRIAAEVGLAPTVVETSLAAKFGS
jgi:hypothetical protein